MTSQTCIIDTNIVVAGLIGTDTTSPPARILTAMLSGELLYLMSADLLNEYAAVLRRPRITRQHGLTDPEIDVILTELVANAIWCEPDSARDAPDPGDNHLWALLSHQPKSQLVTGDQLLIEHPPENSSVVSARDFVELIGKEAGN